VVPLDVGWSDVGAWDALWQAIDRDADGNAVKGDVWMEDSHGNLVIAEHGLVACIGCEDMVVVETADAVLIAPKARTQDVRRIVSPPQGCRAQREPTCIARCIVRGAGTTA
jgi:mannose-1-phosphate guanylyltransferase/mannose-6-phosphate isomerase